MHETTSATPVHSLQNEALCERFLAVAREQLTGTLVATASDGSATKSFLFHQGMLVDLDNGQENTLLTSVLLESDQVTPRVLKKAGKTAARAEIPLSAALLQEELLSDEDLLESIQATVADEVTEAFAWEDPEISFVAHEIDERVEGFVSELSEYFELLADPEDLFLEAARRLDCFEMVERHFDLLLDVFYATPGSFHYFREPERFPAEIRVLGAVDGTKDVQEVVVESGLDHFDSVRVVRQLAAQGEIELINPVQMFQLGTQHETSGNLEKACKLFQRAKERGLNDFDVDLRLAQALDRAGQKSEAAGRYLEFSNKCIAQLRVDDAIESLRRATRIAPTNLTALRTLLDLFLQHQRLEEARETGLALADRLTGAGEPREALDLLLRLRRMDSNSTALQEKIIELAEACNESELASQEREALDQAFHERKDAEQILENYQTMFCQGKDSLEVRLKLVHLHREQGNRQKAIDHINGILAVGGKSRVQDVETLIELHEMMVELKPGDHRSNRWLIDRYLKGNEQERALKVLKAWTRELEKEGDHAELTVALEQLIGLEDNFVHRWSLANALEKLGRVDDSHRELRSLANLAMRRKQFVQAERALDHILKGAPLDSQTRKAQIDLLEACGKKELSAEKLKELATIEVIAGRVQDAEECCRRFLILQPGDAEVVDKLGKLCLEMGDQQKAVEQFLKAAKIHLENRNFGLARRTLDRLLSAQPANQEASVLLKRLDVEEQGGANEAPAAKETTASQPLKVEREPFQQGASVKVKTTVSGITARLRRLKSGQEAPAAGTKVSAVGSIASRLKAMKAGGGNAAAATPAAATAAAAEPAAEAPPTGGEAVEPPQTAPETQVKSATGTLKSAAARLRALAKKSAPGTSGDASATEAPPTEAPATETPATEARTAEATADAGPAAPENDTATAGNASSEGGAPPGAAPPTAKLKQQLAGAASRLAALRKAAE